MYASKDLCGNRFGNITVIERSFPINPITKRAYWLCKCDCGETIVLNTKDLTFYGVNGCDNCATTKRRLVELYKDITGQKFGMLTALKLSDRAGNGKSKQTYWLFKCDCGKEKEIAYGSVVNKSTAKTLSCGCLYESRKVYAKRGSGGGRNRLFPGEANANNIFRKYEIGAINRNLSFELSKEDFKRISQQECYYCGSYPKNRAKKKIKNNGEFVYNGIDRLDNTKGYTLENSVPCCGICNKMKLNYSEEKFIDQIIKIHNHYVLGSEYHDVLNFKKCINQ